MEVCGFVAFYALLCCSPLYSVLRDGMQSFLLPYFMVEGGTGSVGCVMHSASMFLLNESYS